MEQVNTGAHIPENSESPAGHDQKMIDAVDQKQQELAQLDQQQEQPKILGKFESQADLEKAYQELEQKLGQRQESPNEPKDTGEMDEDKASDLITKANVDIDAMAEHFYANGGLSDDHYAELEKAGIPKAYVDQYIAGVQAEGDQMRDALFAEIGGEENFAAMSQWALNTLSESELRAYNQTMESGDLDSVRSAVLSLAYRFERANGKDPQLLSGQGKGSEGQGFESVAQLTEAMKDPRYQKDPAYRRDVEAKLARSNIF